MSKISAYTALSSAASNDLLPVVDVSDTTMAPTGTTKNITATSFLDGMQPSGDTTGVMDTANIQGLLNIAGKAKIGLGTFWIDTDLLPPSNSLIEGSGRGTVLTAVGGAYSGTTGPNLIKISGVSHVIVRNLTLNGNSANITYGSAYNYLHGGTGVVYSQLQGVYILNSDDVTVEDCWIENAYSSGIMAQASTDLNIRGNRLTACGDNQIYVRALSISPYTPCDYVTITGNICSGGAFSGIQVLGSSYITVTGNVCYSNGPSAGQGDGIGSEGSSYVTITGNTCYSNGIQGVNVRFTSEVGGNQASSHVVVSSNVCYDHTSSDGDAGGISVSDADDVLVTDNLVYGNYWGINVCTVSMTATNIDITGNKVRNSTALGIRLAPGVASTFNITDNKVSGGSSAGVYTDVQAWISDNTIWGNTSFGIHFDSGSSNSRANGNTIYDNGDNGIHIGGTGVAGIDLRDNYFTNVSGSQPRGIYEASGNGPTRCGGNRIIGQATAQYAFSHPASVFVNDTHLLETPAAQPAALYLNGSSNYATAADAASLDMTGGVTVEMWLNPLPTQEDYWTSAGKNGQYWMEGRSDGALYCQFSVENSGTTYQSGTSAALTAGRLNHVVGTFDPVAKTVNTYINGTLSASASVTFTTIATTTNSFYLGNRQGFSRYFGGQCADVRVWNGALSAADVSSHYLNPGELYVTASATLVARWKLDEGTGTTLNDTSGNSNTGTLSSGTWIPPYTPYLTQPVLATGASHTVDDVITVLQNLGLVVQ